MNYFSNLLLVWVAMCATAVAQYDGHKRSMERAHPSPDPSAPGYFRLMVPIAEQGFFVSRFLNNNMIANESDPLPAQNESSIAVNPTNPMNLLGSAVDYRGGSSTWAYYSTDGGLTWTNVTLGLARVGWTSSNDPSVCFNRNGKGFLCYGGFNRATNAQFGENGIFVSTTTTGGASWDVKHVAAVIHTGAQTADSAFEDKYYIHVDTSSTSPYNNRLYIPWKRVINADSSTHIHSVYSTDDGLTWSKPTPISLRFPGTSEDTTFGQSFPLIRTGPDGTAYCVWNSGTERAVRFSHSTDGGVTWSQPTIVQRYNRFGIQSTVANQTNSRVKGVVRAETYPTMVVDNTQGIRRGTVYVAYCGDRIPNVYFTKSTDQGATWSVPVIVHSDTSNDQFWPWIALDPLSGNLAVMYSCSREDPDNILVNTWVSFSTDGGTSWVDRRVGDGINDLRNNPFAGNTFAGDYSGCDFYDNRVYPSWVDMRNTTETNTTDNDVYTAVVHVNAPAAPERFVAKANPQAPTTIDLSWTLPTERSFGQPLSPTDLQFTILRDGIVLTQLPGTTSSYTDQDLETFKEYVYTLIASAKNDSASARQARAFAGGSRSPGMPEATLIRGTETNTIVANIRLPNRRADGTTALINMKSVRVFFLDDSLDVPVLASDTGATVPIEIAVPRAGWYRCSYAVLDSGGQRSVATDTTWLYTGTMKPTLQEFSEPTLYRNLRGLWGVTDEFFYSPTGSFAHAPNAPYTAQRRDTVVMFPFEVGGSTAERVVVSARVAAFVEALDTFAIEVGTNGVDGAYQRLGAYNRTVFARWGDTTKSLDAWQFVELPFDVPAGLDTAYLRCTFRSNASGNSVGAFIDDLTITRTTSVHDDYTSSAAIVVYPMPATNDILLGGSALTGTTDVTVVSVLGATYSVPWSIHGITMHVSLTTLANGMYTIIATTPHGSIVRGITIMR
jgi:hypothetical protein